MAMIRIQIEAFRMSSEEPLHYQFPWEGNEEQARASIKHFETLCTEKGEKPGNAARGILHHLPELMDRCDDLPVPLKAGILWYVLKLPLVTGEPLLAQTASQQSFLASITARHDGGDRGQVSGAVTPHPWAVITNPSKH